jgi:hypothetical protein
MIDDIRINITLHHSPKVIGEKASAAGNVNNPRAKLLGQNGRSVRVRSVKAGTQLVIEGSFAAFLQGHNVVSTLDLQTPVLEVVRRVLAEFALEPTAEERARIAAGDIKLERLDFVALVPCSRDWSAARLMNYLDRCLAGSRLRREVYPNETLILPRKRWSLSFYSKDTELKARHPEEWHALDPRLRRIAKRYLRVEMRMLRGDLVRQDMGRVCDVQIDALRETFRKRLARVLEELQVSDASQPLRLPGGKLTKAHLVALLQSRGVDVLGQLNRNTANGLRKQIQHIMSSSVARRSEATTALRLLQPPYRHGAPSAIRDACLVFTRPEGIRTPDD